MLRIGIPRAFYYYQFFNLWPSFLFQVGAEVVISPPTNKLILNEGINLAVDEMCLPFKTYLGHVAALKKECDYVFVPRVVSVEKKCYTCPKILGLPDIAKLVFPDVKLFTPSINQYAGGEPHELIRATAELLGAKEAKVRKAWLNAQEKNLQTEYSTEMLPVDFLGQTSIPSPKSFKGRLALLGHSYNIYDSYTAMNIIDKLRKLNFEVMTSEIIPDTELAKEADSLPKKMFWSTGKELIGAVKWFLNNKKVDGIVYLACFGCGTDSLIGELAMRYAAREEGTPFLMLTIDEQSGEAGVITRIEAFTDMLCRRKSESENNLSPHGKSKYCRQSAV